MEGFLDTAETVLLAILSFAYFVVLSLLFLPSLLIVQFLQKPWEESMKKTLNL